MFDWVLHTPLKSELFYMYFSCILKLDFRKPLVEKRLLSLWYVTTFWLDWPSWKYQIVSSALMKHQMITFNALVFWKHQITNWCTCALTSRLIMWLVEVRKGVKTVPKSWIDSNFWERKTVQVIFHLKLWKTHLRMLVPFSVFRFPPKPWRGNPPLENWTLKA